MIDKISDQVVFAARAESLERENAEFAAILQEYREGILLYQIEQDRVWNRIALSDSLLHLYFNAHRDRFAFPDRLSITEIRSSSEDQIKKIRALLAQGKTFESVAADDSLRMSLPANHQLSFPRGGHALSQKSKQTLVLIADELSRDPMVRVQLIAHPDTSSQRMAQQRVATQRTDAIIAYMTNNLHIAAGRITHQVNPLPPSLKSTKERDAASQIVDLNITGRQPLVVGKLETSVLPVKSDERANALDTLTSGAYSSPLSFKGNWMIVRLNAREPSRQKTYEEAGPEVSSAFQESESKRLESEWLDGLRKQHQVVERKELLKKAFGPER